MRRYALVRGHNISEEKVAAYLPGNYRVEGTVTLTEPWGDEYQAVVVSGTDDHGWTLDAYVIPRLGSGLMAAREIDLSHPAMKQIPCF